MSTLADRMMKLRRDLARHGLLEKVKLPPFAYPVSECLEVVQESVAYPGQFTFPFVGAKFNVLGFDGIVVQDEK